MPVLIGDGGHARDIIAAATKHGRHNYWPIHAHHSEFSWKPESLLRPRYVIGINDSQLRARVATEIGYDDDPWVHPHAYIGPECTWGPGTHINYAVSMTRTIIGHHCTIAPGVTICGDVTLGDRVFVGAGAVGLGAIPAGLMM